MAKSNRFHEIADEMEERSFKFLDAYQAFWLIAAQELAPVDDGDLKNSAYMGLRGGMQRRIGFAAEHARPQEFGTIYQPGTPFLRSSKRALARTFQRDLKQVFGQ